MAHISVVELRWFRRFQRLRLELGDVTLVTGCCSGKTTVLEALLLAGKLAPPLGGVDAKALLDSVRGYNFLADLAPATASSGGYPTVFYVLEGVGGYAVRVEYTESRIVVREVFTRGGIEEVRQRIEVGGLRLLKVLDGSGREAEGGRGTAGYVKVLYSSPRAAQVYADALARLWPLLASRGSTVKAADRVRRATGLAIGDYVLEPGPGGLLRFKAYAAGRRLSLESLGSNAYWLSLTMLALEASKPQVVLLDDLDPLAATRPEELAAMLAELHQADGMQVVATVSSCKTGARLAELLADQGVEVVHIDLPRLCSSSGEEEWCRLAA